MASFFSRALDAALAAAGSWRSAAAAPAATLAVPPEDRSLAELIAGVPPTQEKYPRVLGELATPLSVTSAVSNAHRGSMRSLVDLLSEQRSKVTHLQGVMHVRETAVASRKWLMVPREVAGVRSKAKAVEIANFARARFQAIPHLTDRLKFLAGGGIYFGRSGTETEFFRDTDGIAIRALHPIHARRISYSGGWRPFIFDESGNDRTPELGTFPGVDVLTKYPGRFCFHEPSTVGGEYATRQGVGYSLVWTNLFWNWSTRDWMKFAELHGRPWRVGTYDKGLTTADITKLFEIVKRMSGGSSVALPAGADVKLLSPGNAGSTHTELRKAFNAEISKVVLGQTGTTELGDVGSYSATKVHDLVRGDVLQSDGRSLSECVTRSIVYWLVLLQYGREAADLYCPSFVIVTEAEENLDAEFARTKDLIDRGVRFSEDDLRERYTRIGKPGEGVVTAMPVAKSRQGEAAPADEPTQADEKAAA